MRGKKASFHPETRDRNETGMPSARERSDIREKAEETQAARVETENCGGGIEEISCKYGNDFCVGKPVIRQKDNQTRIVT